jgi:hypothetical protein
MSNILRLLAVVGILAALLMPLIAHASYTPPDTAQIEVVRVFRHMLQPNDVLMIARYDIGWGNQSSQPNADIQQTFEFTYSYGNVTLGNETASTLFNYGYAKGLVAFYWAGNATDKPTYGGLGNVTLTDVADFGNVTITDTYTLQASDYSSYVQPSELREDLRQWIISQLMLINWDWNQWYTENGSTLAIGLLAVFDSYTVLDTAGEAYMQSVQADIKEMCPALFLFNTAVYDYENETWTLSQQSIYESVHATDLIGNITEGLKDLTGDMIDTIWITTFVTMVVAGGLIFACNYWWMQAKIGALGAYLVILVATPEGFFQMGLTALIAVLAVIYLIDTFYWKRSSG